MSSVIDADTLLAVDVGSVNTRASLFDVVDGRYRLVATGRAPSTAGPPLLDISEGVRLALDKLQSVTGRRLVDETEALIMPVTGDGVGVDIFVATATAGPKVRTVLVGLMPGVSMESVQRLAASSYLNIVEQLSLTDRRREDEQIDLILSAQPDLILVAGGTDGGASDSVMRLTEIVALTSSLLPSGQQPRIVYAGNRKLASTLVDRFANRLPLTIAPNVRPSLRHEDLTPARMRLAEVISDLREERIAGFEELNQWSGGYLMVTADAFGRVVRYLSQIYSPDKGVLGVDLGASQTTVAVAFDGTLRIGVQSDLGMGSALTGLLAHSSIEQIRAWLPIDLPEDFVRDYLYDKALNPGTIPAEIEDLHLELAMAREILRVVTARARAGWPEGKNTRDAWLMPALEPIIAAGGTLGRTPRPGYSALVLLDAIQPTGITTLVLDPHNLTPALGVAAGPLPIVSVQVLESGGYVSLGTVISPVGSARVGRRLMRVQLEREASGEEIVGEVRMGQLIVLAMEQGEHGRLTLRPERGIDVGFGGPGKAGTVRVSGGAVGLIIDARGRPLQFPKDLAQRRDLNQKWLWDIGAME